MAVRSSKSSQDGVMGIIETRGERNGMEKEETRVEQNTLTECTRGRGSPSETLLRLGKYEEMSVVVGEDRVR